MHFFRLIIKHELEDFEEYEELFFVTESAAIDEFRRRLNNQIYEEEVWHQGDLDILILNLEDEAGYNVLYKIECIIAK